MRPGCGLVLFRKPARLHLQCMIAIYPCTISTTHAVALHPSLISCKLPEETSSRSLVNVTPQNKACHPVFPAPCTLLESDFLPSRESDSGLCCSIRLYRIRSLYISTPHEHRSIHLNRRAEPTRRHPWCSAWVQDCSLVYHGEDQWLSQGLAEASQRHEWPRHGCERPKGQASKKTLICQTFRLPAMGL